ncbi:MAG: acyl-CoA thioesterase II [bacterium]
MTPEALGTTTRVWPTANGQALVDGLVRLLDLEPIEQNIFRGTSPNVTLQRVFGGQVAGQALVAAGRTVDTERSVHSLHAYFIRGGDPAVPIVYTVDRVRDGGSFSVRRVVAVQHGQPIFTLSASFQLDQDGLQHGAEPPDVPAPETLAPLPEVLAASDLPELAHRFPVPFELRYVGEPPSLRVGDGPTSEPQRIWMRATGRLPDDPLAHVCAVTFASDLTLLEAVLVRHGLAFGVSDVRAASLDHAMWFHDRFRADEWFLYVSDSPSASGGRGLAAGRIFTVDRRHVATVMQEGLLRVRRR